MTRYSTRVKVYESAIQGLFDPGGGAWDEARDIADLTMVAAIGRAAAFSPSPQVSDGGGRIIDSHRRSIIPNGPFNARSYVENSSAHAVYKHEGTEDVITAGGRLMHIRAGAWGPRQAYSVSGQAGDPWLLDAANEVLSRYGVRVESIDIGDLI
jgi:hypothetical protein